MPHRKRIPQRTLRRGEREKCCRFSATIAAATARLSETKTREEEEETETQILLHYLKQNPEQHTIFYLYYVNKVSSRLTPGKNMPIIGLHHIYDTTTAQNPPSKERERNS